MTSPAGPMARSTPWSSQATSSQIAWIEPSECDTTTIVRALGPQVGEALVAPALELLVADGQHLVDEQDVGVDVDGDREAEPHVHARRVVLHRGVDEPLEAGELDDVVEAAVELAPSTGPRIEPLRYTFSRPDSSGWKPAPSSSRADTLPRVRLRALVGLEDAGQALEQRALAGAVGADEAEGGALGDLERHVAQGPELLVAGPAAAHDGGLQALVAVVVEAEPLRQALDRDGGLAHSSSASRPSRRRNAVHPDERARRPRTPTR